MFQPNVSYFYNNTFMKAFFEHTFIKTTRNKKSYKEKRKVFFCL